MSDPTALDPVQQERTLIAQLMLDGRAVWDVEPMLDAGDFADGRLALVYGAILSLAHDRAPTGPVAVADRLERQGLLRQAGGEGELHLLAGEAFTGANATFYAEAVRRAALKRRVRAAALSIAGMAAEEGDAFEIAELARQEIDAAASSRTSTDARTVGDDLDAVLDSLSEAPRFTPTPWAAINELIGGFRPGAFYVIGARPGSGKTIMGLQSAALLAERGAVAFSSLEMSRADLTKRLLAQVAGVSMSSLTHNSLSAFEWERVAKAKSHVRDLPLFIDDRAGVTLNQVRANARTVSRRGHLAAVVVDYLQLMRPSDPRRPRWESVGEMSAGLKVMSRDLDVPVIALCQLNRGTETAGGMRRLPALADLRESGSIEQDADVVALIQREHDGNDQPIDLLSVSVAKNRHGRTGLTTLAWEAWYARVSDPMPV